ncbi:NAD-dependent deacetylase [Chloroflexota bacterium]
MQTGDSDDSIKQVADLIIQSTRIVVFTGAGISTESGIPDFRGPNGLWTKYDPEEFTIQKFLSSAENRRKQWKILAEGGLTTNVEPNAAHYAIAEMERLGKLDCVITQNVDNLHLRAGNSTQKVFELHGNMQRVRCLGCGNLFPMESMIKRLKTEEMPDCSNCGGILKPDAVLFGEALPQLVLEAAVRHSRNSDLFIVIGSTLVVYPAAYMPVYALESAASLVIINMGSTPLDSRAKVLIKDSAGETMLKVVDAVKNILMA